MWFGHFALSLLILLGIHSFQYRPRGRLKQCHYSMSPTIQRGN